MLSASNPVLTILDTLSRYSHDNDLQVAINAIFAMGLVGAGTNNARLAQMLRQLASYYAKEADCLFMVRVSQVCPPSLCYCGMTLIRGVGIGAYGQGNDWDQSVPHRSIHHVPRRGRWTSLYHYRFHRLQGLYVFTPFSLTRVSWTDEMGKKSFSINRIGCSTLS